LNRRALGRYGSQTLISVAFIIGVNLLFGFASTFVDNAAHIGGFAAGVAVGLLLSPLTRSVLRDASAFRIGPVATPEVVYAGPLRTGLTLVLCAAFLAAAALLVRSTYN
jgi:hypothetical protein